MTIVLFDTPQSRQSLYPLSLTRPICDLRLGILTLREKWQNHTGLQVSALTEDYLGETILEDDNFLYIQSDILPTKEFVGQLTALKENEGLEIKGKFVGIKTKEQFSYPLDVEEICAASTFKTANCQLSTVNFPWFLFQNNEAAIRSDYAWMEKNYNGQSVHASNQVFGNQLLVQENVEMKACIVNTETGPVFIGKNAVIMEGTIIRGPVAICEGAVVKMGTKLYGGTTIGPFCTAGGEIKNSILMGYSNKAHDGYLGDAVVGEWCNFGAGATNSNVKNTAGKVKMWNNTEQNLSVVGLKAGLIMGDYSRAAINTSFNTGTTVGVCCNVFGSGYPAKHIPSFSWGNEKYGFEKAVIDIGRWKDFKGKKVEEKEEAILKYLYTMSKPGLE